MTDHWGIDDRYFDALGIEHVTSRATRAALLGAMGVPPEPAGLPETAHGTEHQHGGHGHGQDGFLARQAAKPALRLGQGFCFAYGTFQSGSVAEQVFVETHHQQRRRRVVHLPQAHHQATRAGKE